MKLLPQRPLPPALQVQDLGPMAGWGGSELSGQIQEQGVALALF
jgi:hypothetical protein